MDEFKTVPSAAEEKPKRKTHTSTAVKARYNKKTYRAFSCSLRYDEDAELLAALEAFRGVGMSDSGVIKAALYAWLDSRKA